MEAYKEKILHGQHENLTVGSSDLWGLMRNGTLKKETGMIMAAQDQALRMNVMKSQIDQQNVSPICRLCRKREETIAM